MIIFLLKTNEIFMERADTVLRVSKETKFPSGFRHSFSFLASVHIFLVPKAMKMKYFFYTGGIPLAYNFHASGQYGKSLHFSFFFYLNCKYLTNCFCSAGFQIPSDIKHSLLLRSC